MPTVEVMILGEDGSPCATGEEGQIYVKSLMGADFEYYKEPDKTAEAHLEPGVFTFGDIGYLDADGYLYMSDRKIDMIISGGVNIYPAEIEAVLVGHPAVHDAAVFGIPNEEFGEEIKAAVEVTPGLESSEKLAEDLIAHCREHLAGFKAPRSIDFVDELSVKNPDTVGASRITESNRLVSARCGGRRRAASLRLQAVRAALRRWSRSGRGAGSARHGLAMFTAPRRRRRCRRT